MEAEFRALFHREPMPDEVAKPVCDKCYQAIMARAVAEGWQDDRGH